MDAKNGGGPALLAHPARAASWSIGDKDAQAAFPLPDSPASSGAGDEPCPAIGPPVYSALPPRLFCSNPCFPMLRSLRFPMVLSLSLAVCSALRAAEPAAAAPVAKPPGPTVVPVAGFAVPEGFEITLWAQAPQLRNPTNMDVDYKGRIWVTEGVNYRAHENRDPAGDRIVVLEDTDGDGRADSSHVFIQEPDLIAPLGIAVIDNQIIVSNAPDLIVYTDVDRNGYWDPAIDKREVLLTGFNGRNHDHALHSVTFGPDGCWYFSQGNCSAHFTDREGKTWRVGSSYDPHWNNAAPPIYSWKPSDLAGLKSDDGHVYVGGFTVRMKPDANGQPKSSATTAPEQL